MKVIWNSLRTPILAGMLTAACYGSALAQQDAVDRNLWLTAQLLQQDINAGSSMLFFEDVKHWRENKVQRLQLKKQGVNSSSRNKTYELDMSGRLTRHTTLNGMTVYDFIYNNKGDLARIDQYTDGSLLSQVHVFYAPNGKVSRAVKSAGGSETELFFDEALNISRSVYYYDGVKGDTREWTARYDSVGRMVAFGGEERLTYDSQGRLKEWYTPVAGQGLRKTSFAYEGGRRVLAESFNYKNEQYIRAYSTQYAYNEAGLMNKVTVASADPNVLPDVTEYNYLSTWAPLAGMRGEDLGGGSYGYGTPLLITWANPAKDILVTDANAEIQFNLKPGVAQEMPEIKKLVLRHNGKLTEQKIGEVVLRKNGPKDEYSVIEKLPLNAGRNVVSLDVETPLGTFSSGERIINYRNPDASVSVRNLYVLSIGVSDYAVDGYDLKYANEDARQMAGALAGQQGKNFSKVEVVTLTDAEATRENIEAALRKLRGKVAFGDMAVVFFSGQGESVDNQFYLKPHNAGETRESLASTAISNRWVMEELAQVRGSVLYLLDASHASAAPETETDLSIVRGDFQAVMPANEEVKVMITSSKDRIKSTENDTWQNGAFTEALLEGLNGAADKGGNNDGLVTSRELNDYVENRVTGLTNWKQSPAQEAVGVGLLPIAKP